MAKKKSKFRPVTALKRSVVFDGSGKLRCETCGVEKTITPPVYPDMPEKQLGWTIKFNSRILGFLKTHRECK